MKENIVAYASNLFTYIITAVQTNEIMQIVQLILAIVGTIVTLAYTIYKWYKKAKQDGKITYEELTELEEDIKEVIDKKEDK